MNQEDFKLPLGQKASLVSIVCDKFDSHSTVLETNNSLRELRELLLTLGLTPGEEYVQNRKHIDPATMLGEGKLEEISWEDWYKTFKDRKLDFLYQDRTADGKESRFFKLVKREGK